ncbi:L,D-transpeptidase [Companilactobacillus allii]|uniref:L,D-TPase catalytic domain-containing protein n=1 Tax=Companilactobacillus allii TaxID=1847728 RepID=A0A1P8Q5X4_9LACO|nr:L,D-transpeptidase [Companilactobacillus allii]APX73250.1 hypothetical protein BTM29_12145 [Companilactobacillus allii]USQ68064.1 L,D-transpeptidase [Companilactobacillus allii]
MIKKNVTISIIVGVVVLIAVGFGIISVNAKKAESVAVEQRIEKQKAAKIHKKELAIKKEKLNQWKHPSEKKDYPDLDKYKDAYIEVSIEDQKVYIKDGKDSNLYIMNAATGTKESPTPKGVFHIQNRGDSFYNPESKEGANYWTSFKDLGVYLFHSVPTDKEGKYDENEAHKLGERSSHGCVRLTIPDAKWVNTSVPDGMKVVVK